MVVDNRYRNSARDRSKSPPRFRAGPRPESRRDYRSDSRQNFRSDSRREFRPESRRDFRPDSRPGSHLGPHPGSRPSIPRPHTAYPDVWVAERDPYHPMRLEIFDKRRDSVSRSRAGTPLKPDNRRPATRIEKHRPISSSIKSSAKEFLERDWKKDRPRVQEPERHFKSPLSSSIDMPISTSCASPVELQDELSRYSVESNYLLTKNEWVSPPEPRARCRRISAKEFNAEKAKTLKRWNSVQGWMYGMHSSSLRETDAKQSRELYLPGVIFSAPLHTAATTDEMYIANDDPNLTATPYGTLNSKFRKMIVYRTFGEHLQCIPIYTHNGRGLEGKKYLNEFVSIRDIDDQNPEPFEGPYNGIYASRDDSYTGTFIKGKAVIKLTELYTHRYDAPATIEGKVIDKENSRKRLFDLLKEKSAT